MANGFISGLAGMRAAQGVGSRMGLFDLGSTAMKDLRKLERQEDEYEQKERERKKDAQDREDKRAKDRLKGAIVGATLFALTGGTSALGFGLATGGGSYVGQKVGQGGVSFKTPLGRKSTLRKIARGTDDTFFYSGAKRKLEGYRKDLNDFLTEADRRFDQSVTTSALGDAFTAYQLASLDFKGFGEKIKNIKNLPALLKGDISLSQYKNLVEGGAKLPSSKGVGIRSKLGAGTLDEIAKEGIQKMDFNKEFYGAGYPDYFSKLLSGDENKFKMPKKFDFEEALKLINK